MDDRLEAALHHAEAGAERISRQERLAFMLEERQHPLAPLARALLVNLRQSQAVLIKNLLVEEDRFGQSKQE
ncbi:MAG: hypothetical protein U1E70_16850 [Acetobacteraceae bacterium]|nr:hypothetical protein [Pseudomonadota bacterium]